MTLPVVFTANGPSGYNLTKSLRFRSSASATLSRTPASASNRKTWTFSAWIKRGQLGIFYPFLQANYSSVPWFVVGFSTSDAIEITQNAGSSSSWESTAVFRDCSAWYHVVCVLDTTSATSTMNGSSTDRIRLYVNGTQYVITGGTIPSQNSDLQVNNNVAHTIGGYVSHYGDGYMAEVNFVDGQALTPSSFGETDPITGVWKAKKYGGTYGTNGFYLPFTNTTSTTTLGYDFSGNSNNWTTNNISLTAGTTYDSMTDVPTLTSATTANYDVFNPLNKYSASSITNGNLLVTNGSSPDGWSTSGSTVAFPQSGKWYAEFTIVNRPFSGTTGIGIVPSNISFVNQSGDSARFSWGRVYFDNNGIVGPSNASVQNTTQAPTYTTGDVISVAFDSDNGTVWWAKNGTWTNSGNPATGTNPAYTGLTSSAYPMGFVITSEGYSSSQIAGNWGQQGFTYTPPTGFVALNTYNLPTSTIVKGNTVMDATLYTGDGSNPRAITNNASFKPDFVWLKNRSAGWGHRLQNSVVGAEYGMQSNNTNAEDYQFQYGYLTSFNSNGFTVTTGSTDDYFTNNSGDAYVGWQWQAGQGTTSSNTSGSITSTVSVNPTAGFSVVTYTGNNTLSTVGHGLGVAPKFIIVKTRSGNDNWVCYHASLGVQYYSLLNSSAASYNNLSDYWSATAPSSSVFGINAYGGVNTNGATYVAYCWAEIAGFSKFGSYTGNGSADGAFIYTGFVPKFIMFKNTVDGTANWLMFDSARSPYNAVELHLGANLSRAEENGVPLDFVSNGFKLRTTNGNVNRSGDNYIYMAFASNPFKNSNAF